MKRIIKNFALRGLMIGGFGPLVYGIVIFILDLCNVDTLTNGIDIFKAIISTYILAFLVAGVSVIWQEEKLGLGYAILIHGTTLYLCYLGMYLINNWLPKNLTSIIIFSIIFVSGYLIIWLVIYLIEKRRAKVFNKQLES